MTFKTDLKKEVKKIFQAPWTVTKGRFVPDPEDLSLGNDARKLKGTVLYADIADSTDLVDRFEPPFAARIYKAYLRSAARIIKNEQESSITAYDGDRVMAVFLDDAKGISAAVRSALRIHYVAREIINLLLKKQYSSTKYQLKHVVGIDTSELFVARIGDKNDNDLVWVGQAAKYAAKLCSLNGKHSTYITEVVFNSMDNKVKYDGKDNKELMWDKQIWPARPGMKIYGSTRWSIA